MDGSLPPKTTKPRPESLDFKVAETPQEGVESHAGFKYPMFGISIPGAFKLHVMEGEFADPQIVVMLGENGTGKSTFLHALAGFLKPDQLDTAMPAITASYKPQDLYPVFPYAPTVRALLRKRIRDSYMQPQFVSAVTEPLQVDKLLEKLVVELSPGELQRVVLCICLGKPADVYLIEEPSAYLDSQQRITASKVIKRFIHQGKKTAFVVEHDMTMATYLADRVIVFDGTPSVDCTANAPQSLLSGMNLFLSQLDITVRRDPTNFRPWINKLGSTEDSEQKASGSYYYLGD
ncbi:ABC transporter E family member 2-like [Papaver somniferum]|uniref:ABC transporter E family member 2-like n=1 Tax=Papaver somniferum TaxID=3469 RepID=UPI000E6F7A48|nr:ABC transporter E family member 2-like [Papaver somniferum]XP_026431316.1 ABC transporter E family member 2-like [Papaver somniferum]XP_026431317.1 ABC transporter E family member 2-like [Papaver somniferum]XP_026431318.1 ABC transporter E family member 2-like [Papaver somniferum]